MIKDGLELLKKYGARDLFFIASIVFLYNMNIKQENKIERIELQLYDCLQDNQQFNRTTSNDTIHFNQLLAILHDEKINIRYSRAKGNV